MMMLFLQFGPYLTDLWHVFYPKLSEPGIPVNQNKQALLIYWHQVLVDCPENVQLMLQNNSILKNLPFNYILWVKLSWTNLVGFRGGSSLTTYYYGWTVITDTI